MPRTTLSTQTRLAYLISQLYARMRSGRGTKTDMVRHFRLTNALEREKMLNDFSGNIVNGKLVRKS
jgi:hypothetical protein